MIPDRSAPKTEQDHISLGSLKFLCIALPQTASHQYEISECQSLASKPCHHALKNKNRFLIGDVSFYEIKGFLNHKPPTPTHTHTNKQMATRNNSSVFQNILTHRNTEEMVTGGHTSRCPWQFTLIICSALLAPSLENQSYILTYDAENTAVGSGAQSLTLSVGPSTWKWHWAFAS